MADGDDQVAVDDRPAANIDQGGESIAALHPSQAFVPQHPAGFGAQREQLARSEEHTSDLQSLMRISYAVFCLKKNNKNNLHSKPANRKTVIIPMLDALMTNRIHVM